MIEYVTLILENKRFEVNKEKVASRSHYFESLFSANFNDFHKKEHVINYNIRLPILKDFIEWIHDDSHGDVCRGCLKTSLEKYADNDFAGLLNLLELSVLFVADELTCDIVDIIVLHWLVPEKMIDTWLLAEELNIKVLRDICMSICLDRFIQLPIPSVVRLAKDQFTRLINNVNRNSSMTYDNYIRDEWSKYHNVPFDMVSSQKKRKKKILHGTVVYQMGQKIKCKNGSGKTAYIHIWNDSGQKLIEVPESVNYLVGMQFIAKGFNIYLIGGETGFGTGKFNEMILRYCLLSKKWYYYAKLPHPRRHMIAAFLGNNLILVGGVGKHRLKLNSVDILNMQTGVWKESEKILETFTDVPPHCVIDEALFFLTSALYVYRLTKDASQSHLYKIPMFFLGLPLPLLLTRETTLLLDAWNHLGAMLVSRITVESTCEQKDCLENNVEHRPISYDERTVVNVSCYDLCVRSVCLPLNGRTYDLMMIAPPDEDLCLHIHTEVNNDFDDLIVPRGVCFDLIDPDSLYDTVEN